MKALPLLTIGCLLISLRVSGQVPANKMQWLHEPAHWSQKKGQVSVTAEPKTDFWQTTHYGYVTDNGHFYYTERSGNFVATVKVTGSFKELYDQAGLMIRIDSLNWIKSGVEFANGKVNISAVYTRQFSDWSVIALPTAPASIWLRLERQKDGVELSYSLDGKNYVMQRLGYFPPDISAKVGIMTAAPEGKGFTVVFDDFEVK